MAGLECIISIIRALRMGSCLSSESRSPLPGSPLSNMKRRNNSKRLASRCSSLEYDNDEQLQRFPGRLFFNGSTDVASLYTRQGKKGTNQDAMVVWENFGSRTDTVFCGVFDGHGPYGHLVARRVRDHLPLKLHAEWEVNISSEDACREFSSMNTEEDVALLSVDEKFRASVDLRETEKQPDMFETLKESFTKAYKVMDKELRMHPDIDCFCSGTTAVTLVKQGSNLIVGSIGDSRAVLGTRDKDNSLTAVQLTVDLKPNLPAEAERIRRCRGRVFALPDEPEVTRVWLPNSDSPGLAMTRAFGDFCLKDFGLITVPEVSYRHLSEKDEFVVVATDGIWDVLSNEDVVGIISSASARSCAARALVEVAVRSWRYKYPTSNVDDCAVVCLFLDSNSNNVSTASNNANSEVQPTSNDQVDYDSEKDDNLDQLIPLTRSGTMTGEEIFLEGNEGGTSQEEEMNSDVDTDWYALQGVARVNSLVSLPTFVPEKEDETGFRE